MLIEMLVTWWAFAALAALAGGALAGVAVPWLGHLGRLHPAEVTTPDAVAEGRVLKDVFASGHRFGWDRAWPLYLPHQGVRDARGVRAGTTALVVRCVTTARSLWRGTGEGGVRTAVLAATGVAWVLVVLPLLVGAVGGLVLSAAVWHLCLVVAGTLLTAGQLAAVAVRRAIEATVHRRRRLVSRCSRCYAVTTTPSYLCTSSGCLVIHRDIRPGPLGVFHRRCACEESIPTTVRSAGKRLRAVCPYCRREVPQGSGTRPVLFLPVIGAVSSGKTQFLSAAVVSVAARLSELGGELSAISPASRAFLRAADGAVTSGRRVAKTPWDDRPEGLPFRLTQGTLDQEVQLMDAAGESFADGDRSRALVYFDTADVILFLLDPLSLPKITPLYRASGLDGTVSIAQGDPTRPYTSVIDRLKADGVDLQRKQLALVVTKADVVHDLLGEDVLDASDPDAVRRWLVNRGLGDFVTRVESDFGAAGYFAVDSYGVRDVDDPLHPLGVVSWAFRSAGFKFELTPQPEPDAELEGAIP